MTEKGGGAYDSTINGESVSVLKQAMRSMSKSLTTIE